MTINSATTNCLLDAGRQVDTLQSIKVTNKRPNSSLLKFAEAVAISHSKHDICVVKQLVINVHST